MCVYENKKVSTCHKVNDRSFLIIKITIFFKISIIKWQRFHPSTVHFAGKPPLHLMTDLHCLWPEQLFYFISTSHLNSILHGALCSTVHVHLYNTIHGPLCSSVHDSLCSSGSSFAQHCTCSFAQHCALSNIIAKSILFKPSWNLLLVTTFMPCNFQCVKFSL